MISDGVDIVDQIEDKKGQVTCRGRVGPKNAAHVDRGMIEPTRPMLDAGHGIMVEVWRGGILPMIQKGTGSMQENPQNYSPNGKGWHVM